MNCCAVIDAMGVYGSMFHYAFVIAFVGSAFIVFFYLWRKKRLDMDEEPKFQMMQESEINQGDGSHASKRK
jgi:hypothetical protein